MATKVPATSINSPPVVVGKNKDNRSAAQSTGTEFFPAEEYHQKYLLKNPNGYDCHSSTGIAFPSQELTQ